MDLEIVTGDCEAGNRPFSLDWKLWKAGNSINRLYPHMSGVVSSHISACISLYQQMISMRRTHAAFRRRLLVGDLLNRRLGVAAV